MTVFAKMGTAHFKRDAKIPKVVNTCHLHFQD